MTISKEKRVDPQALAPAERRLVARARRAAKHAYAPYSVFRVGAAVATASDAVFTGANVENASYGLTICAERVAVSAAVAAGHRRLQTIAVVSGDGEPAAPCGACLQVLREFGAPNMTVLLGPLRGRSAAVRTTLGALLPRTFQLPATP